MDKFTRLRGIAAPLPIDDIDTDALAPTAFVTRADVDYGKALFGLWRYEDKQGEHERPDFVLNHQPFRQARILVAGSNFGCGSSREHAVWALAGFGIRCVIAPSFSDIFFENAFKNGFLPVSLPREAVDAICARLGEAEAGEDGTEMTVDLESCTVTTPDGEVLSFAIDPARRIALLEGLDEIGLTLKAAAEIETFQAAQRISRPWIHNVDFQA